MTQNRQPDENSFPECESCTVPVRDGQHPTMCPWCRFYTPPTPPEPAVAERLDVAVAQIDQLRTDLNRELRRLPERAPLLAVADVVVALGHLRLAAVTLDKAADALAADDRAVTR